MAHTPKNIPSAAELMQYLNQRSGAPSQRAVARQLGLKGEKRVALKKMMKELQAQGKIAVPARRPQETLGEKPLVEITGIDSMGDLIARPFQWKSDKPAPEIIIVKEALQPPAGVGDIVQARVRALRGNRYEGEVLRRITVFENQLVGVVENGFVLSVDKRLRQQFALVGVPRDLKLENQDIVLADIPTTAQQHPQAQFVRRIGSLREPFAPTLIAIHLHRLPTEFSAESLTAAARARVPPTDDARADWRAVPFVTIDGADARDFDDAVWAEPDTDRGNSGGWHICVAIADVAWYVRPDTPLDRDAWTRGNSVYFPDRVIPMLPEELSNGVCSLKPHEPRACLVCECWIDAQGNKLRHRFLRALIQSARRLTYSEVQEAMDGKKVLEGLEQPLANLVGAYGALAKNRRERGVLELDVPETQVLLTPQGQVAGVRLREQTPSMQLIEEMMILANVAAAEMLEESGTPAMYRVHDKPSPAKIETLNSFLRAIGQHGALKETALPADFNQILLQADGHIKDEAINAFVLRAQSQAAYSPENIGHFGLALYKYAHFTSPIRRYADILVHRALIRVLNLGAGALTEPEERTFAETARHISATERQAASAEQDANDRYIASFLHDKVGQRFGARITSATAFGLFLQLDETGADGLIPMRLLPRDYYDYDAEAQRLVGRATGMAYQVGERAEVILKECTPMTGGMLFSLVGGGTSAATRRTKPPAGRKKQSSRSRSHSRSRARRRGRQRTTN